MWASLTHSPPSCHAGSFCSHRASPVLPGPHSGSQTGRRCLLRSPSHPPPEPGAGRAWWRPERQLTPEPSKLLFRRPENM